jgi:MFS family permease
LEAHPGFTLVKWANLAVLAAVVLLAMGLWFSASAIVPQLTAQWDLTEGQRSWMTMSVQMGFVAGALVSALFQLADRLGGRGLISLSALLGASFTAAIALLEPPVTVVLMLRFAVGFTLAGVYPPGMKLAASWTQKDRGLAIGFLVGALAVGSAAPHLINAMPWFGQGGMPPWRPVLWTASGGAALAALLGIWRLREGPYASRAATFDWRLAGRAFGDPAVRLANFGYLGHMWELFAMWTWVPLLLLASYEQAGWDLGHARLAGFAVIAIGSVGSFAAGAFADRLGRTTVTIVSLVVSGACCLVAGLFFASPGVLTALCLVWGLAVVADSAQFSSAVSELSDPRYVGTALTVQTSLGFLLTLITIRIVPALVDLFGWRYVFAPLALGPMFGVWSMARLRRRPEAVRMASGHR